MEVSQMKMSGLKLFFVASVVALALVFSLALASPAAAQEKAKAEPAKAKAEPAKAAAHGKAEVVKEKSKDGKGSADPNVKNNAAKNDPKGQAEAPPNKGGKADAGRGFGAGWCEVSASNYTRYYTKIYVDGAYRGMVGPFDTGTVTVGTGTTTFYARADFDDGSYKFWGSYVFNCSYAHNVNWQLGY
jgi:hypothetical protein